MPGFGDYTAENVLDYLLGLQAPPVIAGIWVALFTDPPADDGTGDTEVSGNGYARVQVAGTAVTNAHTTAGGPTLHFVSTPAWVVNRMYVRDATTPGAIPPGTTVIAFDATTVTMSANAAGPGVGSGDTLVFSAWPMASPSSGAEPATEPAEAVANADLTYPMATGPGWGTVLYWGQFDAPTGGNYLAGDYLGAFPWSPATVSAASPGVVTAPAHGYNALDPVVVTAKYGGTLPTVTQGTLAGVLTVDAGGLSADRFSVATGSTMVNTSTTGSFMVRKIVLQEIPTNVTAFFPASYFTSQVA